MKFSSALVGARSAPYGWLKIRNHLNLAEQQFQKTAS
jgi:hypothetical protein